MPNRKRAFVVIGLAVALALGWWLVDRYALSPDPPAFRFTTVERGDVQAAVSATGSLQAVNTVSVGTQVSGQVSELLVDFNSEVKKGQLLARIDPTLARQAVADAQANLERLRAQTAQASRDDARNSELLKEGLIPANLSEQGGAAVQVARASEKSALIALERARQNLSYTSIYAPIDGVVVERNVNHGQTVAASLSAPQLFLIANDLTQMQILAQVGESDIAQIQENQPARFTVQALQGRTFSGEVQQVRLQSTTVDNVVNYTVVVRLANPERRLLPGMTARVDFLVKSSEGVLKVANAALRYRPSEEILAQFGAAPTPRATRPSPSPSEASPAVDSGSASPPAAGAPGGRASGRRNRGPDGERSGEQTGERNRERTGERTGDRSGERSGRMGSLYALGPDGRLLTLRVRVGVTDGVFTEVSGPGVSEGMKVIDGVISTAARPAANPLSPAPTSRRGPGGGSF
jgi:HlyD family secretion protein